MSIFTSRPTAPSRACRGDQLREPMHFFCMRFRRVAGWGMRIPPSCVRSIWRRSWTNEVQLSAVRAERVQYGGDVAEAGCVLGGPVQPPPGYKDTTVPAYSPATRCCLTAMMSRAGQRLGSGRRRAAVHREHAHSESLSESMGGPTSWLRLRPPTWPGPPDAYENTAVASAVVSATRSAASAGAWCRCW